jgi:hypothetical protein
MFPFYSFAQAEKTLVDSCPHYTKVTMGLQEKNRGKHQLEEIVGKHSEENRQISHDKRRQQLSSQSSHLLTAIRKDILRR